MQVMTQQPVPDEPLFLDSVTDTIPYPQLPDREILMLALGGDKKAAAEQERREQEK